MKKLLMVLIVILALLCAAVGILFFHEHYLVLDGSIYRRDITQLDLSGKPIEALDKLTELTALQQLNIENTGITEADFLTLQEALPECEILWSIPFQGKFYPLDTRQLTISALAEEEIATLDYFTQLEAVDATACDDLDALLLLQQHRPECRVLYQVSAGDAVVSEDTQKLNVPNISGEDLEAAFIYLPNLQTVDASGCRDYDTLLALQARYPDCQIRYTVKIGDEEWQENTTVLTLENANAEEVSAAIPYLTDLTTVYFAGVTPDNDAIYAMKQLYPHITFIWSFDLLGVNVSSQDTEVDLSGFSMETVEPVENALKYFNCLERVIMCDCGISNEEMDALGQRNPDVRFVWTVQLGYHIRLRTDATYFMPYQYDTKVTDRDLVNLKYCIDLECLDLGHMNISKTDFLAYMPKMKYLLLADTRVSDISGCANMPELVYVELFMTRVSDFSPLLSCKKLEDLNICYSYPNGIEDLRQMTWLKRLWIKGRELSSTQKKELKEVLKDTIVVSDGDSGSTADGWRESPNYFDMRDFLGMGYMTG